ncbi:hypothetical protein N7520_010495 [Penicillium odoratum]|uniref:uncharacterized protein n=1 Tax=Penicillium odoratum TaxID=1167516 RepID=UPI002548FA5A|nr:uncharacterized protein N7520_010495 [Penicillium odoratum]KAJ5745313.1 hypothetical protein N7520_010495 [Penicillium odoratum]
MPRREPPPGYWEEDEFEPNQRYRPRRTDRSSFEDDVRRRREPIPLAPEMPREFVRETFIVPPRDLEPPVHMRRSADDVGPIPDREEVHMRTRPRWGHRSLGIDDDLDEREIRRRQYRPRVEEDLIYDERERRTRRSRPERDFDEMSFRRRGPPPSYDSELDRQPRERRYSDVRDEVYVRSSESRRKPRRRAVEFEKDLIGEEVPWRPKRQDQSPPMSKEDEKIMQWKDRPSPRDLEEDEEIRVRDIRRRSQQSPHQARYGRGPPGSWPDDLEDEDEVSEYDIPSRRSRSTRADGDYESDSRTKGRFKPEPVQTEDEVDIRSRRSRSTRADGDHESDSRTKGRFKPEPLQTEDEVDIRSRRSRHGRDIEDDKIDIRSSRHSRPGGDIDEDIDIRSRRSPRWEQTDDEEADIRFSRRLRRGDIEDDEIDIRREKKAPLRRSTEIEEVIIRERRKSSPRKRSVSPEPIPAPSIHDVIKHHRNIDHRFDEGRPPRAPSPEKTSTDTSFDEVHMRRSRKGGLRSDEDVSFERGEESVSSTSDFRNPWKRDERRSRPKSRSISQEEPLEAERPHSCRRGPPRETDEDVMTLSEKMKASTLADDPPRKSIDEWSIVHSPKEQAIEMTGALDIIEVAPKDASTDSGSESEEEVEIEVESKRAERKIPKERRDERWTEITKDLVVRGAIEELGYEFEETRTFYYIFSYLEPADIDELVELSDQIRQTRRRRIKEMHRERASVPSRSASLIDRMPPRPRPGIARHVREREWIINGHH